jgi:HK97 family phage major capsid protein
MFGRRGPLTAKEAPDFGPAAFIEAQARRDEKKLQQFREVSEHVRQAHGVQADNMHFYALAPEALVGTAPKVAATGLGLTALQRDMTVAGVSGSQYLVGTDQPTFIETLRSRGLVGRLQIQTIDCTGNAMLPRLGASTTAWSAGEDAQAPDSAITIGAVSAMPRLVSGMFTVSHQLHRQLSPDHRRALDTEIALGVDHKISTAILAGSGVSGQPQGIVNTAGIGSQSGGSIAWAAIAALQAGVDAYDVDDCAWVLGAGAAATLRARTRETGSGRFVFDDTGIAGKRTIVHNAAPSATAVVGCWTRVALAVWGPLEIAVDPFSNFASGKINVAVRQLVDVAVLSPAAFGKSESIS